MNNRVKTLVAILLFASSLTLAQVPTITSFSPTLGPVGTAVTITGVNFNAAPANNAVYFGSVKAAVGSGSTTSLSVTAPIGATFAPITVTDITTGLTAYSANPFTLTFPSSHTVDTTSFSLKTDFSTGTQPYSVAIGDLDGDGKPDVAVVNAGPATVSIFRNISTSGSIVAGSFAAKVDLPTGFAYSVIFSDVDGDGKLDLVVACADGTVSVRRNISTPGNIAFAPSVGFSTGQGIFTIAVSDLDGDGKPDIVVADWGVDKISVFRNTSTPGSITSGSFASPVNFATGSYPSGIAISDIDGDGKPDIMVANMMGNSISVFRNISTSGNITSASFAPKVDFTTVVSPNSVAVADINGDGKPSIVVKGGGGLSVFRNTSAPGAITSASLAPKVDFPTIGGERGLAIGDVDGDGKPDLVLAGRSTNKVSVLRNTGLSGNITLGSFAPSVDFNTGTDAFSVALGDLDGDGKPDVVATNYSDGTISVFRNLIGLPNKSASFDGSNSRIRVLDASPINPGANPSAYQVSGTAITMEAWIFPLDVPTGTDSRYIVARPANNGVGVDPYQTFALFIYGNAPFSHQPRIGISITDGTHPGGTGYEVFVEDTAAVKIGQWTHVAGTYDGTNVKLYINGVLTRQLPLNVNMGVGSTGLYIGGITSGYFRGLIDDVRLWNIARTQSSIQSTMNSVLDGNESGLKGYWPMDSVYTATGGVLATIDKTSNHNDLAVQFNAKLLSFPEGSTVQIAPAALSLSNNYAITGALYSAKLLPVAWPTPTFSVTQKPSGMIAAGDSLSWTPADNQYLSFPVIVQSTNVAGTRIDTFSVFSEAVRAAQNQVRTDVTHRGKMGTYGNYGKGLWYKGRNGLYGGDFSLVSRSNSKFAGGLYSGTGTADVVGNAATFKPAEGFTVVPSRFAGFTAFKTSFTDEWEANRIGVRVIQTVHSSTTPGDDKYAIIEYRVVNESGAPIGDLFSQLSTDFDIGSSGNNLGGYDSLLQMNYGYESGGANDANYYGFSLLNKTVSGEAIWFPANSGDTIYVRSTRLLTQKVPAPLVPGDIRNQISSGPFSLASGDTLTVAFAVFAGDNLADISQSAARARYVYSPPSWKLQLTATVGSYVDVDNYLGISPAATDGFDQWFDLPKSPNPVGNYVQLYFPHPEYGAATGDNFAQDIRQEKSLADTAIHWRFNINTNVANTPVSLSFIPDGIIPPGFGILLKDITAGTRRNLKANGMNYSYNSGAGGIRKFEIMVGDSTAPTLSLVHPNGGEIIRSGGNYSIQWNGSDRVGLDSIRVLYSTNAGTSYNLITTLFGPHSNFTWAVPQIYLNNQGSVAVIAIDSMGNTTRVASNRVFTFSGDSLANAFTAGWNLIGTPLRPNDSTVAGNFSDDIGQAYYVFDYSPLTGYTTPNALIDGRGYWLGLLNNQTVDVIGKAITDSIVVPLAQGFNIISNPLVVAVPKTGLIFSRGGTQKSYQSAIDTGWIAAGLTGFNSVAQNYQLSDTLQLWSAYWLGVLQPGVSVVVKPPMSNITALLPSTGSLPKTKSQTDWQMNIIAEYGTIKGQPLTLGVKSDAVAGFDVKYDIPKAPTPPVSKYVESYFLEPTWAPVLGSKFVSNITSPSKTPQWTFYVSPSDTGSVTLTWTIPATVPDSIQLSLVDGTVKIDMRKQPSYSFETRAPHQLIVNGRITLVKENAQWPTDYTLGQNYPNPFNPSTSIEYTLPVTSVVRIEVFNALGQRVATLHDGEQAAGYKKVLWNANVSSGIYFYHMEATAVDDPNKHFVDTKKMLLLK